MQEVRGSNPRSSTTGQTDKFETLSPRLTGLVQQQNTATRQDDVLLRQSGSVSGARRSGWHDLLKLHLEADSQRSDQEEHSFCLLLGTCTGAGASGILAGDSCRLCNRSGPSFPARLLFGRLACLQTDCAMAQHGASAGAGRGQLGVKARGVARRGATWRIFGARRRAAAPPGAGQARDGAPIWPRQARRASGLTGGR